MKTIFIFIFSLSLVGNVMAMGSPKPTNCLDDSMRTRIKNAFSSTIEGHSSHGRAMALYEIDATGKALKENAIEINANSKRPVASIQKILSAYVAFENKSSIGSTMRYSINAENIDESSSRLPEEGYVHNDRNDVANVGDNVSYTKTMTELLRRSANGAGYMIAESIYIAEKKSTSSIQNVEAFYADKAMTAARQVLGNNMTSIFKNPHGLDVYAGQSHLSHGSTASEMARLLAGLSVRKSSGKRFDDFIWSLGSGLPYKKGRIFKNGSTLRAGKTFIALEDVSSGSCKGKRVSLSIFGDGEFADLNNLYNSIIGELYK
jgi:D-alanyl-D-alanine carboxypeptidase